MNTKTLTTHLKAALAALEDVPWYDPSESQKDAFCAKTGFPRQYADGWPGAPTPNEPGTWQGKIAAIKPADLNEDSIKEYHGMGFAIDGSRPSWTSSMLSQARHACYDLELATTPAEQDAIAGEGASNLPTPTVRILLMAQAAGNSAYYGPLRNDPTITNAAKFCVGIPFSSASGTPEPVQPGPGV